MDLLSKSHQRWEIIIIQKTLILWNSEEESYACAKTVNTHSQKSQAHMIKFTHTCYIIILKNFKTCFGMIKKLFSTITMKKFAYAYEIFDRVCDIFLTMRVTDFAHVRDSCSEFHNIRIIFKTEIWKILYMQHFFPI